MLLLHFTVAKDGIEHWSDKYEVLTMSAYSWMPKGSDMTKAIVGGNAGDGEPFYVCSSVYNNISTPGKLYKPTGCCYVAAYGKEHCMTNYSFLTPSNVVTFSSFHSSSSILDFGPSGNSPRELQ
jgi:hypothetical protein